MKVHLRLDRDNGIHSTFTLFIDGHNCGRLVVSSEDAVPLYRVFETGCKGRGHTLDYSSKSLDRREENA